MGRVHRGQQYNVMPQYNAIESNAMQRIGIQYNATYGCTVGSPPIRQMMQTEQSRGGKQGPLSNAMQNTNTNQDTNTNEKDKHKFKNRRKTASANQNFGRE